MSNSIYQSLSACTSVLVGKNATMDGSLMIARNEDAKAAWPKHFVVHAHQVADEAPIFTSKDTGFKLELPKENLKYTATPEWTDKYGVFEEDGFNELGVAMSATESAYANSRVLGYDPLVEHGIGEEAMVTVVLPYVDSARAGIQRLGELVVQYGTSESNGILFADQNEAWYMETGSGHHWVAQRIPDDSYAVVANQLAIQEIDFDDAANFMFDNSIRDFAANHHLWQAGTPFNFRQIFGTHDQSDAIYNTPRVWYGQKYLTPSVVQEPQSQDLPFLRQADRPIQLEDVTSILASHFQGTPYDPVGHGSESQKHAFRPISLAKTQESHVLQIRPHMPAAVADLQWLAMGVAAESSYVPFYGGITDTPANYKVGQLPYSPDSAYWLYKHVSILVDAHYPQFSTKLEDVQKAVHSQMLALIAKTDQAALAEDDLAKRAALLTQAGKEAAQTAGKAYQDLAAQLITAATDYSPLNFHTDANL
ncbi:pepD5 protein [Lactobacillus selangorensis]|uniref:Dipeptidase n=1 Tax=Lactobacillus selangorensis TaxID=81857 RepID=A0A0R2G8S3_9LACO|nr:C69 family dipeptidase [Lactobacillus selangorensis]KRN29511.1 pepD5 protein [Lactobacillus selangorensis]KRN33959.1 pepD5 protein [Lactobacillus selangorensis]